MGSRSCGDWLQQKLSGDGNKGLRLASEAWLVGYLSGAASASGKDVIDGSTASSFFAWMDNYCQSNPLDRIGEGGTELFLELMRRKGL